MAGVQGQVSTITGKVRFADIDVSLRQEEKYPSWRAKESAHTSYLERHSSGVCLSAVVPVFAEPDIRSLSRAPVDRHSGFSWCSLPVLKQSGAQSGRTRGRLPPDERFTGPAGEFVNCRPPRPRP